MTATDPVVDTGRYRFAPRDRTGWMLGLNAGQCLSVLGGLLFGVVVLRAGGPLVGAGVMAGAGVLLAFAPVGGAPACETAVVGASYLARRRKRNWNHPGADGARAPMPAICGDLRLATVPAGSILGGAGVLIDSSRRTVTAAVGVRGREFALVEAAEQARLVATWGEALGGFCTERSPVIRVALSEWAAPQGLGDHLSYLDERVAAGASPTAVADYRAFVQAAAPMATGHGCVVTVTVAASRLRARVGPGANWIDPAIETLGEQVRLLSTRLDRAGLGATTAPSAPALSAPALARGIRDRLGVGSTTNEAVGPATMWPSVWRAHWRHVQVGGLFHACFSVAEWPRLDVGPGWMEPLVLHPGSPRTLAMVFEPLSPSRSARQVERDAIRVATDEAQRERGGWRVGARQARTRDEIAARETELVAGYPELGFWGLVSVCAPDTAGLERACAEYEQAAAAAGLALARLDGRHDLALIAALPLGIGVTGPWFG